MYWLGISPSLLYYLKSLTQQTLFIGFSFYQSSNSLQGLQNTTFSLFTLFSMFGQLAQQIMPHFVVQRSLYESRERPSKAYSWKAFILSNVIVEMPWNLFLSVFMYCSWYYALGLEQNAVPSDAVTERGALMFLFMFAYLVFTSTFSTFIIAGIEQATEGASLANLMFSLSLMFCGVLASKEALPGFWIFMYRVSPFTYLVSGMLSTALADAAITCAANEFLVMQPPSGVSCGQYLEGYINATQGYLKDANAMIDCQLCPSSSTNAYLGRINIEFGNAWRDFGLVWVYIVFNIAAAMGIYWLARVPKKANTEKVKKA